MKHTHTITGHTKIIGVIGDPVKHSCSPQMHNAAIAKANLDYVYVPFHVTQDAIANAMNGFSALNVVGINVTLPHKQAVIPFLTSISQEAQLIGAVNTLTFNNGKIHGENTDAPGFIKAMEEAGISVPIGKDVVVLGAGGSARAIVVALSLAGVRSIVIANRTVQKAIRLAEDLTEKIKQKAPESGHKTFIKGIGLNEPHLTDALNACTLLVNTSSSSMDSTHPLLINPKYLQPNTIVYDIVYTPPMTTLLTIAAEKGCTIIGGIGMLVHQGAIAFERWTGVQPCTNTMKEALSLT